MSESVGKVLVVGVDFQRCGDEAILAALRMLDDGTARKVHLLHVLDPRDVIDAAKMPALHTEEQVIERAPSMLRERALQLASSFGLRFDEARLVSHARVGSAVDTLLQMTVDYDADMLVVGTHSRRGIERLVLGSVAEALVRRARCPVLIARPKDYAGLEKTQLPDPPYAPGQAPEHQEARVSATEHVVSTESSGWHQSDAPPTGVRIV